MIRRLKVDWPAGLVSPVARTTRLLAVSDEREQSLADERNRRAIEPIDIIVGCGDLEPDYLSFLGDAFHAPLLYVRGNHDHGGAWEAGQEGIPVPLAGRLEEARGIVFGGLGWPTGLDGRARRDEGAAWRQTLSLYLRVLVGRQQPAVILSHVPPYGLGDTPGDPYHTGFNAYRWLCRRLQPVLWLHGHTALAAAEHWRTELGRTTLVNVTGAAVIELERPPRLLGQGARHAE